jgi:carbonic anhydrase
MMSVTLESPATISGGPLNAEYELYQYHFHWGDDDNTGSENQMNGKSYPMEMHMVTWNTKYDSFSTAASQSDGLAVMGFFFEITDKANTAFDFVASLASITEAESSAEYMAHPKLQDLLSSDMEHYFTLLGSLTTPPCSEVVTWLNFKKPIKISSAQVRDKSK